MQLNESRHKIPGSPINQFNLEPSEDIRLVSHSMLKNSNDSDLSLLESIPIMRIVMTNTNMGCKCWASLEIKLKNTRLASHHQTVLIAPTSPCKGWLKTCCRTWLSALNYSITINNILRWLEIHTQNSSENGPHKWVSM
jgi:hypothetical protein